MAATYPAYLQAVTIVTGVNDTIVFDEGSGNLTATLAAGTYFLRGYAAADDLGNEIANAMTTAGGTYTVSVLMFTNTNATRVTITKSTGIFKLSLANSTFPLNDLLGFTSSNETLAIEQVGADYAKINWVSNQPLAGREISNASNITQHLTAEGQVHTYVGQDGLVSRLLEHELVSAAKTKDATGSNASFEAWWGRAREGHRFEFHDQTESSGTLGTLSANTLKDTLTMGEDACRAFAPARLSRGLALYSWSILCRRYVA